MISRLIPVVAVFTSNLRLYKNMNTSIGRHYNTNLSRCNNLKRNTLQKMPCYKKHKAFLIYCRLSTKEGLFTETTVKDQDVGFAKYNQDLYRECEWCYQVFEIEKAFKENEFMCNECYKLLQKEKN